MMMKVIVALLIALMCCTANAAKLKQRTLVWNDYNTAYPIDPATLVLINCIQNEDQHCKQHQSYRITHWIMSVCIDGECREFRHNGTVPPGAEYLTSLNANAMVWKEGVATFKLKVCRFKAVKRESENVWDEIPEVECSDWSNSVSSDFSPPGSPKNFQYNSR